MNLQKLLLIGAAIYAFYYLSKQSSATTTAANTAAQNAQNQSNMFGWIGAGAGLAVSTLSSSLSSLFNPNNGSGVSSPSTVGSAPGDSSGQLLQLNQQAGLNQLQNVFDSGTASTDYTVTNTDTLPQFITGGGVNLNQMTDPETGDSLALSSPGAYGMNAYSD
jgi:hypothetical protein